MAALRSEKRNEFRLVICMQGGEKESISVTVLLPSYCHVLSLLITFVITCALFFLYHHHHLQYFITHKAIISTTTTSLIITFTTTITATTLTACRCCCRRHLQHGNNQPPGTGMINLIFPHLSWETWPPAPRVCRMCEVMALQGAWR